MAEKDILEKVLMSYADVFADCENVLVYGGKRRLKGEDLQPAPTESFYRGRRRMHSQFCDTSFYHVKNGEIKAHYIIENETRLKSRQILRKASYTGGAYRVQVDSKKKVYPVIAIVLEWTHKSTRLPISLHKLLKQNGIQQEELELVDDMQLKVCHMNHLTKEVRRLFVSDMGFVVDYLNEGSFEGRRNQRIIHLEALCEMMEELTGDRRFTDLVDKLLEKQKEGKGVFMCEYIDMLEAKGENRLAQLIQILLKEKKYKEIELVSADSGKRHELYQAYEV